MSGSVTGAAAMTDPTARPRGITGTIIDTRQMGGRHHRRHSHLTGGNAVWT